MKKLKFFAFLLLGGMLSACSSGSVSNYAQLEQREGVTVFESQLDAVKNATPVEIGTNEKKVFEITIDKPVMKLGSKLSNFAVAQAHLEVGSYNLNVFSGCHECLGFRKKALLPHIKLYDSNYEEVFTVASNQSGHMAYGATLLFDSMQQGTYYVLLAADNRKIGQARLISAQGYTPNGGSISFPMGLEYSPEGVVELELKKVE